MTIPRPGSDFSDTPSSPSVSIALCTYNGARYIAEQLDSLLAQTHEDFEIVVSDDASADDTVAIIERYVRQDSRIRLSVNAANVGFARNFERVLRECRGKWVAPCDQDDIWMPEKLSALLAAIGDRPLAYCDSTLIDESGNVQGYRMSDIVPMFSGDDPAPFAFGNCVSGHSLLARRTLIESALPVPEGFFYDWWLAAAAAAAGGVVHCASSLVCYRQHGSNVTAVRLAEMIREAGIRQAPSSARDLGEVRQRSSRDEKLQYLRETQWRLAALARLGGRHQPFIARLHRLWQAREMQWFSPALGWTMVRHRLRLLSLTRLPEKKQRRYSRKFFRGLRLGVP
jgi:Glycosyl transferase family 2